MRQWVICIQSHTPGTNRGKPHPEHKYGQSRISQHFFIIIDQAPTTAEMLQAFTDLNHNAQHIPSQSLQQTQEISTSLDGEPHKLSITHLVLDSEHEFAGTGAGPQPCTLYPFIPSFDNYFITTLLQLFNAIGIGALIWILWILGSAHIRLGA